MKPLDPLPSAHTRPCASKRLPFQRFISLALLLPLQILIKIVSKNKNMVSNKMQYLFPVPCTSLA